MGNITPELQNFTKIKKLINSSRFNEAFMLIKNRMQNYPALQSELLKIRVSESTYSCMVDYIFEGHEDPTQNEVIASTKEALHHANDLLLRETRLIDSNDMYSSLRRMERHRENTLAFHMEALRKALNAQPSLQENLTPEVSEALNAVFNYVWTMYGEHPEDYDVLSQAFEDNEISEYVKSVLVSAIILGNISYFNPDSFNILLTQYAKQDSIPLKAKAIVGILLISLLYPTRVSGNPLTRSSLLLSKEDEEFKHHLNEALIFIIRTYDTTRIDNKMRNEVIPGLMKIKPEIMEKMRDLTSDSENFLSDANPQWEEFLENSDIGDKLREINDMQLEGADVMVTAFSNLKNFPFFSKVMNWFLPFVAQNYEFENLPLDRDAEAVNRLTTVMCDSDLHSFLLSLNSMPSQNRDGMLKNMEAQMKEAKEAMTSSIGETPDDILVRKMRHALQDLYRFFKYFRKKEDFNDPFSTPYVADQIQPLLDLLDIRQENLSIVAEFYFKNKYYEEAAGFFELLDSLSPGDFRNWEKLGFAYDRLQNYDKALQWYRRAELINPDNPWLVKKLALTLKNAGKFDEALEYYEKALNNEPENYHLLMSAAQSYLVSGKFEDALHNFYHAQYLKPDMIDPLRAVAWAELLAHHFDKANPLYNKLLQHPKRDKTDYLNAGHAALASGNKKAALAHYKDFLNNSETKDITYLLLALKEDAEATKRLGIPTSDLRLIIDKIRYDAND